jgi:hypothetical protein
MLGWLVDGAAVVAFYALYTVIRNELGSKRVAYDTALDNAHRVIDVERALHIFREPSVQGWFLDHQWLLVGINGYYHVAHYIVPIAVLVFLRARHRGRLRRAEAVVAATMCLALIGFAVFPLAPPRLVPGYGFVDTIHEPRSTWDTPVEPPNGTFYGFASNQFAAMPSVHFAWPVWAAWAAIPFVRRRWLRVALLLHVLLTLLAVVATANHWFLDLAAGAGLVALFALLSSIFLRSDRVGWVIRPGGRSRAGVWSGGADRGRTP